MKEYQLDIFGNAIPIDIITKEKKCDEKYKKQVLKYKKEFLKKGILNNKYYGQFSKEK